MVWIALKMLTGDRSKYFAILFGVTFACLLIAQQSATFCGIMLRTTSQIRDIHGADLWVVNAGVRYIDDLKAISDNDVFRVRGAPGVAWAVNFYKGMGEVQLANGHFQAAEANHKNLQDQWDRAQQLWGLTGIAEQEYVIARQNYYNARTTLALVKAGAWEPDKAIARANVAVARAHLGAMCESAPGARGSGHGADRTDGPPRQEGRVASVKSARIPPARGRLFPLSSDWPANCSHRSCDWQTSTALRASAAGGRHGYPPAAPGNQL